MKSITLILLLLLSFFSNGDSLPPFKQSVYIEGMAMTQYKSPMVGFMLEQSVLDARSKLNFIIRSGIWYHPIIVKSNFFVIQCGVSRPISKKLDVGIYFMNLNGKLPKPRSYDEVDYYSPLSLFIETTPFVNKKLIVHSELGYYFSMNKLGFTMAIRYKIHDKVKNL